ncbi:MAG TPA: hypothetical protein QGH10_16265 [Armatimonadota bacterium]|nr:hypothetical protein [Armatimonadota bacterium]
MSITATAKIAAGRVAGPAWAGACKWLEQRESPAKLPHLTGLRVALVKQSVYTDLYYDPNAKTPLDLIGSSAHRSGPVALLTDFPSQFFIVETEPDDECQVWQEKARSTHPEWDALTTAMDAVAVPAASVDWGQFDVVLAIENAVPERITRDFPAVLWATMVEHHRMSVYKPYLRQPPSGYDCFLNQHFGPTPRSLRRRAHVVEFPYALNRAGSITDLFGDLPTQNWVVIERNQIEGSLKDLQMPEGVDSKLCGDRTITDHLRMLVQSKILFSPRAGRRLWGNAAAEAAAADCVVVGNRHSYWNPCMIDPRLHCTTPPAGIKLVERLLADDDEYHDMLTAQRARLDWYAFWRPLQQLNACIAQTPRPLSAQRLCV